jgi:hypothetical protein
MRLALSVKPFQGGLGRAGQALPAISRDHQAADFGNR